MNNNYIRTKEANVQCIFENDKCKVELEDCQRGGNDTEDKWYELYTKCDSDLKSQMNKPEKDCTSYCTTQSNTTKQNYQIYIVIAFIVGIIATVIYYKKDKYKSPSGRLPPSGY